MTINIQDLQNIHENKIHGRLSFPYTVYRGNIPEYLYSYPLHWHDEMEIIYINKGHGTITVQSHQYNVNQNDIIIILPQMLHAIEQFKDCNMEYFNILFQFSLLNSSNNNTCYEKYFKPLYNHTRQPSLCQKSDSALNCLLLPHIHYLINNRKKSGIEDELMIKSNLFAIMHYINQYSFPTSSWELSQKNNYETLKYLLLYVQSHYQNNITVKDAAALCGFSSSHFMKLFRELTGRSFSHYLIDFRLEIAAEQLLETSDSITNIAHNVGFHNLSYFSRAFQEKYGVSPSKYRNAVFK